MHSTPRSRKTSPESTFKIVIHSSLFLVQAVIFTLQNAIFFELFLNLGLLTEDQEDETGKLTSFLTGMFFFGKIVSDPLWGLVRDKIGDKKSITLISFCLFFTILSVGFCHTMVKLGIVIFLVGFSSGLFVPATAFLNWIEPKRKDFLAKWTNIFSTAGHLTGPFIGSILMHMMPKPKVLWTWGSVSVTMLIVLVLFLYAFRDFDDMILVQESQYSKLTDSELVEREEDFSSYNFDNEEDGHEELNEAKSGNYALTENQQSSTPDERRFKTAGGASSPKKVRFDLGSDHNESEDSRQNLRMFKLRILNSRKKIKNFTFWQIFFGSSPRRNLILSLSLTWCSKLMDSILFGIWAETSKEKGGLGFSSLETGAVYLLAFPAVSFALMACFRATRQGLQTYWLNTTALLVFIGMVGVSLLNLVDIQKEAVLILAIFLVSLKEGSYLLWISTWSHMSTQLYPSKVLGRVISWSYCLAHLGALAFTQIFPRGLTWFIESEKIAGIFGKLRFFVFFVVMGIPLLVSIVMIKRMKSQIEEEDMIEL